MARRFRPVQDGAAPVRRPGRPLRLGISACLLGERVRWDGRDKHAPFVTETLGAVEWVPVCPEVELGLGVPREPVRLEGDPGNPRLRGETSRRDHTDAMTRFAIARVAALARLGLSGYVLKSDSPSCGLARVAVHGHRASRRGRGIFARVLTERLPALPVAEEWALRSPARRARFLAAVRAYARSREGVRALRRRRRRRGGSSAPRGARTRGSSPPPRSPRAR